MTPERRQEIRDRLERIASSDWHNARGVDFNVAANRRLAAHAPDDLRDLLTALETSEARVRELEAAVRAWLEMALGSLSGGPAEASREYAAALAQHFDAGREYEFREGRNVDPEAALPTATGAGELTANDCMQAARAFLEMADDVCGPDYKERMVEYQDMATRFQRAAASLPVSGGSEPSVNSGARRADCERWMAGVRAAV
jgi:hypothetical protein